MILHYVTKYYSQHNCSSLDSRLLQIILVWMRGVFKSAQCKTSTCRHGWSAVTVETKKIKLSILTCNFKLYKATKCWVSVLRKRAHPKNIDAFVWFINILAHLLNLFHIFPSYNFKLQKIVILPKIRTFPTNVFCQCVKLNHYWIRLQELEILVHVFSCT